MFVEAGTPSEKVEECLANEPSFYRDVYRDRFVELTQKIRETTEHGRESPLGVALDGVLLLEDLARLLARYDQEDRETGRR